VGYALARGGWMEKQLMAKRSGGSLDHGGVAHEAVRFPEVDRSNFEKIKSKNFKKRADPRLRITCRS
jgi:hypothetical protein